MKRNYLRLSAIAIATLLVAPVAIHAQDEKAKDKEKSDKKDVEQIIITRKGDNKEKVTVEINGDKVTVNGKPIEDLKDGDITVNRHKGNSVYSYSGPHGNWSWNDGDGMLFGENENTAMLGVVTDKVDEGVKGRTRRELLDLERRRQRAILRQRRSSGSKGADTTGLADTIWKPPGVN